MAKVKNINNINPDHIQSIEVLKDKAAIDKFGEEGKNGVIKITLKKGTEFNFEY